MGKVRRTRQKPEGYQVIAHERTFFKVLDLMERLPRGKVLDSR